MPQDTLIGEINATDTSPGVETNQYKARYKEICNQKLQEARKSLERYESPDQNKPNRDRVSPQRQEMQREEVALWEEINALDFKKTNAGYTITGVINQGLGNEKKIDINTGVQHVESEEGVSGFQERTLEVIVNGESIEPGEAELYDLRYGSRMLAIHDEVLKK